MRAPPVVGGALLAEPCWRSLCTGSANAHDDLEANVVDVFGAMFGQALRQTPMIFASRSSMFVGGAPHVPPQIMGVACWRYGTREAIEMLAV